MAMKIRDLAVKVGEYTDRDGNTKGRYLNVGAMMKGDDGEFLVLHRTFNPAGVPNPQGKDSVLISCFKVKDRDGAAQSESPPQRSPAPPADFDDSDIPF